ncbi:LysR substrate-binding domain-containing protein [Stutzerimonas nitrititolerans]|uniref:LysR substrate-binding domain-containing protein n=1 Tax=Stutzerimonas nitrititolerans TaxID=2482751 RepID=UPI0035E3E77D
MAENRAEDGLGWRRRPLERNADHYAVALERPDVYTRFLVPAHCRPRRQTTAETTELMLLLCAAGRGVSVLPDWLLREQGAGLPLCGIRLGHDGLRKRIHLGLRRGEEAVDYMAGFIERARGTVA